MSHPPRVCAMCKQPGTPDRPGNLYDAEAANGMRLLNVWVCNPCAIGFGPEQGMTDTYRDALRKSAEA